MWLPEQPILPGRMALSWRFPATIFLTFTLLADRKESRKCGYRKEMFCPIAKVPVWTGMALACLGAR